LTIVSHKHKLIFLKTRKTAGTSIELLLSSFCGVEDVLAPLEQEDEVFRKTRGRSAQNFNVPFSRYLPRDFARLILKRRRAEYYNHMPAAKVRRYVGTKVWDSYLKVSVERDRYERGLSMYRWAGAGFDTPAEFLLQLPKYKISNEAIYCIHGKVAADVIIDYADLEGGVKEVLGYIGVDTTKSVPVSKYRGRVSRADALAKLGESGRKAIDSAHVNSGHLDLARFAPSNVLGGSTF